MDNSESDHATENMSDQTEAKKSSNPQMSALILLACVIVIAGGLGLYKAGQQSQTSESPNMDAATASVEPVASADPTPTPDPFTLTKFVNADESNVRQQPTLKGSILTALDTNVEVKDSGIRKQADNITWANIQLPGGQEGWISQNFLSDQKIMTNKIILADKCVILSGTKICVGDKVAGLLNQKIVSQDSPDHYQSDVSPGVKFSTRKNDLSISELITNIDIQKPFVGKTEYGFGIGDSGNSLRENIETKFGNINGQKMYRYADIGVLKEGSPYLEKYALHLSDLSKANELQMRDAELFEIYMPEESIAIQNPDFK